ncbi:hypothetical protein HXA34_20430 [Salipaludibacillus agaradhaerens]|jgi:predicted TIM-barrel fold metal-dependent hydrolase|uniref:hypothetical protein n=1 Tax=Salipaludibacillus agaradhaerens TaxID=76935 RepID=UPI0021513256|nr:hypothetical protein [Salipaludibacillus agaradhaerens]MCR6108665.1 hypothetical protein [Salipaludibacillus agaradhaerens]MCR6120689.1 hypothetical protein [Salipaludibacillus agaradhaerens]
MEQIKEKFYDVTMTVKATRRVLATSQEEAIKKADTVGMTHEIKNYHADEELSAEEVADLVPDCYAIIDHLASQSVQNANSSPIHRLIIDYERIRKINQDLRKDGKVPYKPPIFYLMVSVISNRLKRLY